VVILEIGAAMLDQYVKSEESKEKSEYLIEKISAEIQPYV
jgi:hypothetical protein